MNNLLAVYQRAKLSFENGEGAYLIDRYGRKYLDFMSGIGVNALGHAHPHLVATLQAQATRVWHLSNQFEIPDQERLAKRIAANTFADQVFFTNSGAEAVEATLKIARRYHYSNGNPERHRFIVFDGAFHGRTLATIAAGDSEKYRVGFGPTFDGFDRAVFGDINSVSELIGKQTAGILIEPVQGEGGVRAVPPRFLQELRALADRNGILLMLDEVQCGNGRTGKLFAHEWYDVRPDIVATAKGMGGGFPMGACLTTNKIGNSMDIGSHGTTFGGNPLAMAIGNAVFDIILAEGFLQQVEIKAIKLRKRLQDVCHKYPQVLNSELRGSGLMIGVQTKTDSAAFVVDLRGAGLLTVTARDNIVRLLPPLIIEDEDITTAVEMFEQVAAKTTADLTQHV